MRGTNSLIGALMMVAATAVGCHQCLNGGPGDPQCACQGRMAYNLPPSDRLMEPGPGVGGPGPGVIPPVDPNMGMGAMGAMGGMYDGSVMPASYMGGGPGGPGGPCCGPGGPCGPTSCDGGGFGFGTSQIAFLGADGLAVSWDVSGPGTFDSGPLQTPGRQDFPQGSIYRLRLSNLPGRDAGIELFPTLEIAPATPRTDAFLAHSPIPVQFTEEDFDQVLSGNFVTKVIYLPDPEFQEVALSGVETLVSTRLDPGVDPIAEADRRGSILAILRVGNKDLRTAARGGYGPGYGPGPGGCAPGCYGKNTRNPAKRVVPASYENGEPTEMQGSPFESYDNGPVEGDAQYGGNPSYGPSEMNPQPNESAEGAPYGGGEGCGPMCNGGGCYGGPGCGDGYGGGYAGPGGGYGGPGVGYYGSDPGAQMPLGMPTAGFAPPMVPPQMVAGGPTWGMPITGTPIGLPGPPHIPLGVPAGLQNHVIKNRTREYYPPPVTTMTMSVKQRPGMNYPNPVNHVSVDETHREPGGFFNGLFNGGLFGHGHGNGGYGGSNAQPGGPDAPCQPQW